jgi:hypothetical protein
MEALAIAEITFILVWGICLLSQVIGSSQPGGDK